MTYEAPAHVHALHLRALHDIHMRWVTAARVRLAEAQQKHREAEAEINAAQIAVGDAYVAMHGRTVWSREKRRYVVEL